jgi:O-antigen/teichoic acid export membrane protein
MTVEERNLPKIQRDTLSSMFTGVITQSMIIVSGVLSARILGVEERGNLALLLLFPVALTQIGSIGVPLAITYFIARERAHIRSIVRSGVIFALVQAVLLVAIHAAILASLTSGKSESFKLAGILTLITIPAIVVYEYGLAILQGQLRFRTFNILRLVLPGVYSLGVLLTFLLADGNLVVVTSAWVLAAAVQGIVTLFFVIRSLPAKTEDVIDSSPWRLVRFGAKAFLGSVSPVETLRFDQAVVGLYLSPTALGLYVVGKAFTNLPRFLAGGASAVAYPYVSSHEERDQARRMMWRFFWLIIVIATLVVIALGGAADWLIETFFGTEFSGAVGITRILLVNALFISARLVLAAGARGAGQPSLGAFAEIASWVVLIPAMIISAPRWGAEGAAIALAISSGFSLLFLLGLVTANRGRLALDDQRFPDVEEMIGQPSASYGLE